jgi:hypothetical protein
LVTKLNNLFFKQLNLYKMKINLKFAIFFILVAFMVFYACNKESSLKSKDSNQQTLISPLVGQSCFAAAVSNCVVQSKKLEISDVIGYTGCTFEIEVDYCLLFTGGNTQVTMGNYKMVSPGCSIFVDSLALFLATLGEADENAFISRFDKLIYEKLENHMFLLYGANTQCGNSNGQFTLSYVKQTCSTICFTFIDPSDKDPKDGGSDGVINNSDLNRNSKKPNGYLRANCTSNGCCRRDTKMCYNPNTNTVEKEVVSIVYSQNGATPIETCAGGSVEYPPLPSYITVVKCNSCSFSCN